MLTCYLVIRHEIPLSAPFNSSRLSLPLSTSTSTTIVFVRQEKPLIPSHPLPPFKNPDKLITLPQPTIMAIYSSVPPPSQQAAGPSIDIEAWTVSALESLSISPSARGTGVTLSIPLDNSRSRDDDAGTGTGKPAYARRKEPLRRDSLKRREALLRGKEGSRRRQRWENGESLQLGFLVLERGKRGSRS